MPLSCGHQVCHACVHDLTNLMNIAYAHAIEGYDMPDLHELNTPWCLTCNPRCLIADTTDAIDTQQTNSPTRHDQDTTTEHQTTHTTPPTHNDETDLHENDPYTHYQSMTTENLTTHDAPPTHHTLSLIHI